ncbi:MAG: SMC-Scp complex subunit ScpB [Lachnospiraceae bacterium]|nr:SMC-Scp complex subunit ScpB [Lachnospiraceae bacterium]MDY5742027.1 SMC-Scp complex subunit ScpB [Lachnospiraceae bacterium]
MTVEQRAAVLEGILFAIGEPTDEQSLAAALECTPDDVGAALIYLSEQYGAAERGIELLHFSDGWQLATKKSCYPYLIPIVKQVKQPSLTQVQLETLSIIAYKQPVTKTEMEHIRGVKCDHAVNRLVELGLVEEQGRLDAPGRPVLFGTTARFLRHMDVSGLDALPTPDQLVVEELKLQSEQEIPGGEPEKEQKETVTEAIVRESFSEPAKTEQDARQH